RDGQACAFDGEYVASLDAQIAPLSAHGVVVSLILLACQSGDAARDALLVHPDCKTRAPNGIAAFDTVTAGGRRQLRAAVAFLAARYSGGGAPRGRGWDWGRGHAVSSPRWWAA